MVFVSGQLPIDPQTGKFPDDDIAVLTRRSLDNISAVLYEAGMTMRDVVKTTIFLVDMNDFKAVNEVYAGYFDDVAPARSAVAVAELPKGARIEIEAIAISEGHEENWGFLFLAHRHQSRICQSGGGFGQ